MVGHVGAVALSRPGRHADLDEDDVRVRPGRGSRPRTRRRPAHDDAAEAFVTAVDRGRYTCVLTGPGPAEVRAGSMGVGGREAGEREAGGRETGGREAGGREAGGREAGGREAGGRAVTAMKARELVRGSVVVGDIVSLAGDVSGDPGTLARIVRVAPRKSVLRRSADDTDPVERIVVANAEQLGIVCALANPPPRPRLIDRFLVAGYDAGLDPLLILTKADLASPDDILATYAPLGIRFLVSGRPLTDEILGELRALLANRISVLVGHSGVGKSTLVNTLIPDAGRAVGTVSPVTGRGRHTSSSVVALRLPGGGWIIDTPGLRSFGLGHISADRVVQAFPDLAEGLADCAPRCTHLGTDCALDSWVSEHDDSGALAARLDSLRRLLRSREGRDDGGD